MTNVELLTTAHQKVTAASVALEKMQVRKTAAIPRKDFYETMRLISAANCALQEIECRSRTGVEPIWSLE